MANDYLTTDIELQDIANAIRTKGGTTALLVFPAGFVSAIQAISTGTDVSDTTATASDVLSGKYFYTSSGTKTQGSIATKTASNLSASGKTVTVPAGYYASQATKDVSTLTLPTSVSNSATSGYTLKTTIGRSTSDQYINIGTGYNETTGYYKISAVANGSVTAPSTISGTSAILSTGTGTLTLTKTISVTPNVTTAGYISSGTAGNATVTLTASVNIRNSSDLSASGATVTVPAGYYGSQVTKSVTTMTLPTSTAASATSGYTSKATVSRSTSDQYINIAPGYNSAGGYYKISAVANGSATTPATTITSNPTISINTSTGVITASNSKTQSVTPTISAGYISSGTAGTITVSGSNTYTLDVWEGGDY